MMLFVLFLGVGHTEGRCSVDFVFVPLKVTCVHVLKWYIRDLCMAYM